MNILIILTLLCKNNNETNTMYSIADTQIINIKMMERYKYHTSTFFLQIILHLFFIIFVMNTINLIKRFIQSFTKWSRSNEMEFCYNF